ncbi:MAG: hypothetical protein GY937_07840 [bacterium]|nr:hypothetical protein [bacterium]
MMLLSITGPRMSLLALLTFMLTASGAGSLTLDLADMVGGGDGTGTGTADSGINLTTGAATTGHSNELSAPTNTYVTAAGNAFVDGVFVPDGGAGGTAVIAVSSTGTTATGISDSTGFGGFDPNHTWDHPWNGDNALVSTTLTGTVLGAHANKGITFDLDAIEAANPGLQVTSASLTAAMGTNAGGLVDYYAFLDGSLAGSTTIGPNQSNTTSALGSINILPGQRFLTLVTSSAGEINNDWSFWLDPTIELLVPEPSLTMLLGAAGLCLIGGRRRS